MLRVNLRFLGAERRLRTILITSSLPQEGKTLTACNLAITLAAGGESVALVDADLRRPSLHRLFGLDNQAGLTTLLAGEGSAEACLQPTHIQRLAVLVAGPKPPNPAELLGLPRTGEILGRLTEQAAFVIVDAPPLVPVADAAVLAGLVDGVILVVQAGTVAYQATQRAKAVLERAKARILGVVLSGVTTAGLGGYSRYYSGEEGTRGRHRRRAGGRHGRKAGDGRGRKEAASCN